MRKWKIFQTKISICSGIIVMHMIIDRQTLIARSTFKWESAHSLLLEDINNSILEACRRGVDTIKVDLFGFTQDDYPMLNIILTNLGYKFYLHKSSQNDIPYAYISW